MICAVKLRRPGAGASAQSVGPPTYKRFKASHKPAVQYPGPFPKHFYPTVDMDKYTVYKSYFLPMYLGGWASARSALGHCCSHTAICAFASSRI